MAKEIPVELLDMVKTFIKMRHYGQKPSHVKKYKEQIDKKIKKLKLKPKDVYFYFGDPDDPKQREKVMKKIAHVISMKNLIKAAKVVAEKEAIVYLPGWGSFSAIVNEKAGKILPGKDTKNWPTGTKILYIDKKYKGNRGYKAKQTK